ncbi:hypothetical protein HPP92_018463 [Vanilla planifolia]|uniref:CRAL-TRIO domain-containing protein n=1 Tax=Vanilla planifolia TaxID=51239 RepID=A0A835UQN6_VANPL|nr:hypothetical protein HPP92_018463 [Vanilla planifolia]
MNASREKMQKMQKIGQIESLREGTSQKTWKHLVPLKTPKPRSTLFGELLSFVIKVAALEIVRRISKANCPTLWRVVQAFQVFSYPPLKWLQRWGPLWIIVKGAQKISKPLLLLSIATTFSDYSNNCRGTTDKVDDSLPPSRSLCETSTFDAESEESSKEIVRDNWQLQLFAELEKQGISLPERFKEDELHRFYAAANGDFACLVCSLKKTIRWRESFNILSSQELEVWSHLVFWHRCDAMVHPCLVIRLGLACSTLAPLDRPCFARAIVSQIDHGILSLMNENDARIMVLMDCEGLSILKLPINMIRSYIILVQDHYPNRLGTLFILRLPRVIRVLAQSFIQVLMAGTRKKIRIVGKTTTSFC